MNDPVLEGFIEDFANDRGLRCGESDLPRTFEAFSAYSILRKYHQLETNDIEHEVLVSGKGDGGLDAISILVNGCPVKSIEDIDYFLDKRGHAEVDFVFAQSKLSSNFDSADIGHFLYGVQQFFSPNPGIVFNAEVMALKTTSDYIFRHVIRMRSLPNCFLYYVTTGKWRDAPEPTNRLEHGREQLKKLNLFHDVSIQPIDGDFLKSTYRELKHHIEKEIEFPNSAIFPDIQDVQQAYIGLLSGDQFVKLISRDDGELNRELFYSNIRDFQGDNAVNEEIHQTLLSAERRNSFPLLNNGITIVARSIVRTGNHFLISGCQIVNGCQTTHVLHLNRERVDERTFIPVKLVATDSSQAIAEIIKANNRQTAVLPEAWASLTAFHKELEDFYSQRTLRDKGERIYYERRSKQYMFDRIKSRNIITLSRQIQSFISMFLNEPHSHHRYYGELLESYKRRLFVKDHRPDPYYASGITLVAVERLFNSGALEHNITQYKFHILMLLRMKIAGADVPMFNSRRISKYVTSIVDCVRDSDRLLEECTGASFAIREGLKRFEYAGNSGRNPPYRRAEFTSLLMKISRSDGGARFRKSRDR